MRPLPGDSLISSPVLSVTHAITIDAAPARVWPWLAQMGGGRGGWYSWDRIDNRGVDAPRDLILTAPRAAAVPIVSWVNHLEAVETGGTRLLSRSRISGEWIDSARHAGRPGQPLLFIERLKWRAELSR